MYTLRQVSTGVILQWWQIKEEQIKTKQELFTNYPTLKCVPIYMLETDRECKIKRSWQKNTGSVNCLQVFLFGNICLLWVITMTSAVIGLR